MSDIELASHFDRMNMVVEQLLKGNNATQIARTLDMKRAEVLELMDEWKSVVHNDTNVRDRAKEALLGADQHYDMLIKELWKTVEDADTQGLLSIKAGALKSIADIESKRIAMLQSTGVLENNEMASAIAETERKQELLVGILKEVTSTCPKCKMDVARRLSQITGIVESVVVEQDVV